MSQYTTTQLDSLLRACIAYSTENEERFFYTGNVTGREGVSPDGDKVAGMLDYLAELDKSILVDAGFGKDNIHYYCLGTNADSVMNNGGFEKFFRKKKNEHLLSQFQAWSPIFISVGALVVSALAWQIPKSNDAAIADVTTKIDSLRKEHSDTIQKLQGETEKLRAATSALAQQVQRISSKGTKKSASRK